MSEAISSRRSACWQSKLKKEREGEGGVGGEGVGGVRNKKVSQTLSRAGQPWFGQASGPDPPSHLARPYSHPSRSVLYYTVERAVSTSGISISNNNDSVKSTARKAKTAPRHCTVSGQRYCPLSYPVPLHVPYHPLHNMGTKRSRRDSASSSEDYSSPYLREQSVDVKIVLLDADSAVSDQPAVMRCSLPPHEPLEFGSFDDYDVHYQKTHMNRCSECQKNFPDDHFLNLHIAEHHDPINASLREKDEKTVGVSSLSFIPLVGDLPTRPWLGWRLGGDWSRDPVDIRVRG